MYLYLARPKARIFSGGWGLLGIMTEGASLSETPNMQFYLNKILHSDNCKHIYLIMLVLSYSS